MRDSWRLNIDYALFVTEEQVKFLVDLCLWEEADKVLLKRLWSE